MKFKVKIPDGEITLKQIEVIPSYLAAGGLGYKQFLFKVFRDMDVEETYTSRVQAIIPITDKLAPKMPHIVKSIRR